MKILRTLAALGCAALFVLAWTGSGFAQDQANSPDTAKAPAKGHEYAGTQACKMCHSGPTKGDIYGVWQKSAHAKATASLPDESKKDTKCLACHSTGFGQPGGYDPASAATPPKVLEGVGCESCHGPGKDYKGMAIMRDKAKAKEAGLITPTADTCKGCHEGAVPEGHKERPKFDWATMYPKIEHHIPKPAPSK